MSVLHIAVPGAVVAYVFWEARQSRMLLCGLPFVLALGRSVFIDLLPTTQLIAAGGHTLTAQDLLFGCLGLCWILSRNWRRDVGAAVIDGWWVLGGLLLFYLVAELIVQIAGVGRLSAGQIIDARDWFYIPLGFWLMLDMLRRFTAAEAARLVRMLSRVTVALTILYVANARGAHIYPYQVFQTITSGGATFARDFSTLSIWLGLALAYYLSRPRVTAETVIGLIILVVGCFFSFTRSIVILVGLMVVAAVLCSAWKQGNLRRASAIVVGVAVIVLLWFTVLPALAPAEYAYFGARWSQLTSATAAGHTEDLVVRTKAFESARRAGAKIDPQLGAGLLGNGATTFSTSYDSDWITIVYVFGPVGLALFGLPLVAALISALRSFFRSRDELSTSLSLALLLFAVWALVIRFVSVVYIWWFALGLAGVALIATNSARRWYVPPSDGVEQS